jgi:DNA-binding NarL/FixJ family response regulator
MEPTTITESAIMRVVIVDDTSLVRERLKALLHADAPYAEVVGEAGEAQAAIRLILDTRPDVVILDLQLSGASGLEVLRAVKLAPHAPVVIMLTNLALLEYQITCLKAGAEFFLDKSFGFKRLADILRDLARKSGPNSEERNVL